MIYKITLEDSQRINESFEFLQKGGDFLLCDSDIIFHTKYTKKKITNSLNKMFGNDFSFIIKELNKKEILQYSQIVYKWYAQDTTTLQEDDLKKYQQEALSILNEVIDRMLDSKGGEIIVGDE